MGLWVMSGLLGCNQLVAGLLMDLVQTDLETVDFGNQSVLFELHQHFFLRGGFELRTKLSELLLKALLLLLVPLSVLVQFLFLLLHPSVIDFLELHLLLEFVVGRPSFVRNHHGLIELLLEHGQFVR